MNVDRNHIWYGSNLDDKGHEISFVIFGTQHKSIFLNTIQFIQNPSKGVPASSAKTILFME
jgi:hypothetical protein